MGQMSECVPRMTQKIQVQQASPQNIHSRLSQPVWHTALAISNSRDVSITTAVSSFTLLRLMCTHLISKIFARCVTALPLEPLRVLLAALLRISPFKTCWLIVIPDLSFTIVLELTLAADQ